jgi:hypothetical protein
MIRAAAVLSAALLAAALGAAQNSSASGAASSQNNYSPSSSTVRGCLSSSSLGDDHFTLTVSDTGTVFTLSGLADQLRSQVGHEVEITGTNISNSDPKTSSNSNDKTPLASQSMGAQNDSSASTGKNALEVTGVRMLTNHCTASSVGPSGGPDIPQSTPQGIPHMSGPTATSSSQPAANADARQEASTTSTNSMDANASLILNAMVRNDPAPDDNLPANSGVLPLLGVAGLCSLVAGFIVRR